MSEELVPGFYQGQERQRGLKSGRVAPRDAVRPSARSQILNDNRIEPIHPNQVWSEDNDQYDPNQGALFDVNKVAPRIAPELTEAKARTAGVPSGRINVKGKDAMGMAGAPGFLPNLTTHKQKIAAINNAHAARSSQGNVDDAVFAPMLASRERVSPQRGEGVSTWYAEVNERTGESGMGHAPERIQNVAAQIPGMGYGAMARAVARTSPQAQWIDSNTGDMPNLHVAGQVMRAMTDAKAHETPGNPLSQDRTKEIAASIPVTGGVLPANVERAAEHYRRHGNAVGAYDVQSPTSQKTGNFDAAMHLSHIDPVVRKMAFGAYTVDRQDAKTVGMDNNTPEFQRRGVYDVVAHTGKTMALRRGRANSVEQQMEWEQQKLRNPDVAADAPRLFNPDDPSSYGTSRTNRRDQRSSIAQKYDLEF